MQGNSRGQIQRNHHARHGADIEQAFAKQYVAQVVVGSGPLKTESVLRLAVLRAGRIEFQHRVPVPPRAAVLVASSDTGMNEQRPPATPLPAREILDARAG